MIVQCCSDPVLKVEILEELPCLPTKVRYTFGIIWEIFKLSFWLEKK